MTNKQIANFIARKYFEREEYKEFKVNHKLKIEKDAEKIISLLKKRFNLSTEMMKNHIDEMEKTQPMPKTQLLVSLIDELAKQGLEWKTREELFTILFPKKDYKKYEKSWNQWLTQHTENIRNKSILVSLQERLDFEASLWKTPEVEQKKIIQKIAQKFIERDNNREDNLILLKPIESDITGEQQKVIDNIRENIQDVKEINRLVQNNLQLFTKKAENQYFLLEILPILYENSFYTLLNRYIFPSLLPHHKDNFYIKMKEVNSLINIDGSSYEEIYSLLDCIKPKSKNQETDILTMKISTFRKFKLKGNNITKDILFEVLSDSIKYYNHTYKKNLHYYPAINLAYMLKLYSEIIPDSQKFKEYDIEKIYLSVQNSIKKDKKGSNEDRFYATMSDLEFCILLEKEDIIKRLEESLKKLNPSKFLTERPLFQMIWFVNLLEDFSEKPNNRLIKLCYSAIDVLEIYIYTNIKNLRTPKSWRVQFKK